MLLFLIGYMGSGKSSLGPALAERLGLPFVDLDKEIETKEGRSIAAIFKEEGEDYFRALEANTLQSFDPHVPMVIATGGGAPCFHNNMDWMLDNGIVFYLSCSPEIIRDRLLETEMNQRPLIRNKSEQELLAFITQHLKEREIFYQKAHFTIDGNANLESLMEDVAKYASRFKRGF